MPTFPDRDLLRSDLFSWKVPETHPKLWKEIITRKKDQPGQCQSTIHVSDLEIPRGKKISTKVKYVKLKEMRGGMDKMGLKQALKTKPCILSLQSLEGTRADVGFQRVCWERVLT